MVIREESEAMRRVLITLSLILNIILAFFLFPNRNQSMHLYSQRSFQEIAEWALNSKDFLIGEYNGVTVTEICTTYSVPEIMHTHNVDGRTAELSLEEVYDGVILFSRKDEVLAILSRSGKPEGIGRPRDKRAYCFN